MKKIFLTLSAVIGCFISINSQLLAEESPIPFVGNTGDSLLADWTSDNGNGCTTEVIKSGDKDEDVLLRFRISDSEGPSGRLVHSPMVPITEGAKINFDYVWSGEGLYNDPKNIQKSFARAEILFISDDGKFIPGETRYYFDPATDKADFIEIIAPKGAAKFAVRMGLTRIGDSLGSEATFTAGNFKLVVKE